jgi:uncharacterized protein
MFVTRTLEPRLRAAARQFPVVTVTGPRQSGKSTLCRMAFPEKPYVSLESPDTRDYARHDPRGFLRDLAGGAILDEIQRVPELFSYLQVEVDEHPRRGRFVLTGSVNFQLMASISQSLAGRTALLQLLPLSLQEIRRFPRPPRDLYDLLFRGGYPALHRQKVNPVDWQNAYVGTYVERDVRQLLNVGDLLAFQTFLRMCATRSGQLLNLSGLGADCGVNHGTARAWLSVLETSFLVHRLPVFAANLGKRLVKTPKLHFLDSGLLCFLLGIQAAGQLRRHPLRGAIFESWVVAEILKGHTHRGLPPRLSFFRDRKGEEVDLVVEQAEGVTAIEVKSGETVTGEFLRSLDRFDQAVHAAAPPSVGRVDRVVVYGGSERQERSAARIVPWSDLDGEDWTRSPHRSRSPRHAPGAPSRAR